MLFSFPILLLQGKVLFPACTFVDSSIYTAYLRCLSIFYLIVDAIEGWFRWKSILLFLL